MTSGEAALALKAVVVTAVLAVLVLPSLGRCPSLGPEPPAAPATPVFVPAPAPGPPISCDDCRSQCYSNCEVSVPPQCSESCDHPYCEECSSPIIKRCEADCCSKRECGTCNCIYYAYQQCFGECNDRSCQPCLQGRGQSCRDNCESDCNTTCV